MLKPQADNLRRLRNVSQGGLTDFQDEVKSGLFEVGVSGENLMSGPLRQILKRVPMPRVEMLSAGPSFTLCNGSKGWERHELV